MADPNLWIVTTDWHLVSNDAEQGGINETRPTEAQNFVTHIQSLDPIGGIDMGDIKDHYGPGNGDEHDQYISKVRNLFPYGVVNAGVNATKPILPGNHDEEQDYGPGTFTDFSTFNAKFWGPPYNWTTDWPAPKLRFIGIHTYTIHDSGGLSGFAKCDAGDRAFLTAALAALPAGWKAIICTHFPIPSVFGLNVRPEFGQTELLSTIAANAAKIVCCLHGHRHGNMEYRKADGSAYPTGYDGTGIPFFNVPGCAYAVSPGSGNGGFVPIIYNPATGLVTLHYRFGPGSGTYAQYPTGAAGAETSVYNPVSIAAGSGSGPTTQELAATINGSSSISANLTGGSSGPDWTTEALADNPFFVHLHEAVTVVNPNQDLGPDDHDAAYANVADAAAFTATGIDLDGVNDHILIPGAWSTASDSFAFELEAKRDASSAEMILFSGGLAGSPGLYVRGATRNIEWWASQSTMTAQWVAAWPNDGLPHHIGFDETDNGIVEVFLDGVSLGTRPNPVAHGTAGLVTVGAWGGAGGQPLRYNWDGKIRRDAMYPEPLGATRWAAHYNALTASGGGGGSSPVTQELAAAINGSSVISATLSVLAPPATGLTKKWEDIPSTSSPILADVLDDFEQYRLAAATVIGAATITLDKRLLSTGAGFPGFVAIGVGTVDCELRRIAPGGISSDRATITLAASFGQPATLARAHAATDQVLFVPGDTAYARWWGRIGSTSIDAEPALQNALLEAGRENLVLHGLDETFYVDRPIIFPPGSKPKDLGIKCRNVFAPADTNGAATMLMQGFRTTFTAAAATDLFTTPVAHELPGDDIGVVFKGAGLPAPVVSGRVYYPRDRTATTFRIAATRGGAAINITTDGSGDCYTEVLSLTRFYPDNIYIQGPTVPIANLNGFAACVQQPTVAGRVRVDGFINTCATISGQDARWESLMCVGGRTLIAFEDCRYMHFTDVNCEQPTFAHIHDRKVPQIFPFGGCTECNIDHIHLEVGNTELDPAFSMINLENGPLGLKIGGGVFSTKKVGVRGVWVHTGNFDGSNFRLINIELNTPSKAAGQMIAIANDDRGQQLDAWTYFANFIEDYQLSHLGTQIRVRHSMPADADIANKELIAIFDATAGAAKLTLRGRNASGTIVAANVNLT